jgi:ketosteroid isomerase-like protein
MRTLFQIAKPLFAVTVAAVLILVAHPDASAQVMRVSPETCPKQLHLRSPEQVLESHLAAFRSGNAALLACDFAKDAVLILPGSVAQGPDQIQATFAGFFQAAGAINSVTVTSTTTQGGSILMTYKVDSEHILVSDGVDTFVIEKGRIVLETAYLGGLTTR